MKSQIPAPLSQLASLPDELLLHIMWLTDNYSAKANLARACKRFYNTLIMDIYCYAGKRLKWEFMFEAAADGNCRTLKKCHEAGAPIDYRPNRDTLRPLQMAIKFYRPATTEYLLKLGANPNFTPGDDGGYGFEFNDLQSPLQQAVDSALQPCIPIWAAPVRWRQRRMGIPGRNRLELNSQKIISILRQAGAKEKALRYHDRRHLEAIELGHPCCTHHNARAGRHRI
ncbi:hypothetical protein ACHAPJ_007730 [Fusarium lateritium]